MRLFGLLVGLLSLIFLIFQIWISDDFQVWLKSRRPDSVVSVTSSIPAIPLASELVPLRPEDHENASRFPLITSNKETNISREDSKLSQHTSSDVRELKQDRQPYNLDRIAVFLKIPTQDDDFKPEVYIGFRNGSSEKLSYKFISVNMVIDGIPVEIIDARSNWIDLSPANNMGGAFKIKNSGIVLGIGSQIEIEYEIEIKKKYKSLIENRMETVRKTVLAFNPVRTSEYQVKSRSIWIDKVGD